ncbi:MAG: rod shape-determining protein RodA [Hyphomicrobiaceae bacterium]
MTVTTEHSHGSDTAARAWSASWPLVILVVAIAGIGAAMLYSVAGGSYDPWAKRRVVRMLAGLAVLLVFAAIPIRAWLAIAYPVYIMCLGCLVAVALFGLEMGGAKRWISIAGLAFQPAELMKIAIVLVLARYYQWIPVRRISHPVWLVLPLLLIVMPVALIAKQPDLGTASLIAVLGLAIMFLAGVSLIYFAGVFVTGVAAAPFVWGHMHSYQKERVLTFLEPARDPLGKGYQVLQSKIALGSGGISGKGFLNGTQSQLDFIPEKHTDFIFTMLAEEFGFLGSLALLALYGCLLIILVWMALRCRNHFARLVTFGASLIVFSHMFVNVAMVMGVVPVAGVPLPLVSYGGTSMMVNLAVLGLAASGFSYRHEHIRREDVGAVF